MTKQELRRQMRAEKNRRTPDELHAMSERLVRCVLSLQEVKTAHIVLTYASLRDEVETDALLEALVKAGKTVLLPKVLDGERMEARRYTGRQDLREGAFHIMEPVGVPFSSLDEIDLAIIPGMAFTPDGRRLGRGKGYYDRFLSQLPESAFRLGLCFPFQVVADIPTEPHDMRMNRIAQLVEL